MALAYADWVVTEAGFAVDLGGEKFFDIKCRMAGLDVAAVVVVATVRALKRHGGVDKAGLPVPDPSAVERGMGNLEKHLESVRAFGKTPVVALNRFDTDSVEEIDVVRRACEALGVPFAVSEIFARGGEGGVELAEAVLASAEAEPKPFKPLYDLSDPIKVKMEKIARQMYGARDVHYTPGAEKDLKMIAKLGGEGLPLCVAKTPTSLSDNPSVVGRPEGFDVTVRSVVLAAGAGYVVPLLGEILRMPGLPANPQAVNMDVVDGKVVGLLGS
jgi:formate--tetrahydrofolate ligase